MNPATAHVAGSTSAVTFLRSHLLIAEIPFITVESVASDDVARRDRGACRQDPANTHVLNTKPVGRDGQRDRGATCGHDGNRTGAGQDQRTRGATGQVRSVRWYNDHHVIDWREIVVVVYIGSVRCKAHVLLPRLIGRKSLAELIQHV